MFSSASVSVFVCVFVSMDNAKTIRPIFTKFGGKVAHGPRKEPLDFDGNPVRVRVTVGLELRLGVKARSYSAREVMLPGVL